jgi:hypothetical protein
MKSFITQNEEANCLSEEKLIVLAWKILHQSFLDTPALEGCLKTIPTECMWKQTLKLARK